MNRPPTTLSPRDFASVLGVSESSVRRWIDGGRIDARRTAGGHRRIRVDDALRFIRETDNEVQRGDLLGWRPEASGEATLESALLAGHCMLARDLLLARYAAGVDIAVICDELICPAMSAVGELWEGGVGGVLLEHRATTVVIEALHRLRAVTEVPSNGMAVGGSVERDPYLIPSLMAATVLSAGGYDARDLGADTPFEVFLEAVDFLSPDLVWVSVSTAANPAKLRDGVVSLLERAGPETFDVVLGGRELNRLDLGEHPSLHLAAGMCDLQRVACARRSVAAVG